MNLTTDDLLAIIGAKEAELFALRRRVAELEASSVPMATTPTPIRPDPEEGVLHPPSPVWPT